MVVFFSLLMGGFQIGHSPGGFTAQLICSWPGQTAPYIEAVASARGAASNIFGVIGGGRGWKGGVMKRKIRFYLHCDTTVGRWPPINSGSERGMRPVSQSMDVMQQVVSDLLLVPYFPA